MPFYPGDFELVMQPALRAFVLAALGAGWPAIWADGQGPGQVEEGPPPQRPYASLRVLDLPRTEGQAAEELVDVSPTAMTARVRQRGLVTLEVQLFATTPQWQALERIRRDVARVAACEGIDAAGMAIERVIAARDLSRIVGADREFRYVIELEVSFEIRHELENQPFIAPDAVEIDLNVS